MNDQLQSPPPAVAGDPMIDPELVTRLRQLQAMGWGAKRIARELGIARNTVRAYLRGQGGRTTPRPFVGRKLDADHRTHVLTLFEQQAQGNAVVAHALLAEQGHDVSVRTVQRAVRAHRQGKLAAQAATVRFETQPGAQMQIDFGEKWITIGEQLLRIYLLVAVLSFSRRLFVQAFLSQRQDDWREGLVGAFRPFGGVPVSLLCDNASSLVRRREPDRVIYHPAFAQFCRDWDVVPRACRPYRARTKGKVESGVKYVKHNALAGRRFASFAALEEHLRAWMGQADRREHGTTHQEPQARFEREEQQALRPLPQQPLPVREQRLRRKVANDALVDIDTVRYSVPHPLVRQWVEVLVGPATVDVFHNKTCVASHPRSREPFSVVREPRHYEGLWRPVEASVEPSPAPASPLESMGRSLQEYADAIGEVS